MLSPTPKQTSPLNLMQERYREDPWALLVGTILFGMVHGSKAQPVHEAFLERWPTPRKLVEEIGAPLEMIKLFKPLGFQNKRAQRVFFMSVDFLDPNWSGDPLELYGIGKYGSDSYKMFVQGYLVEDARDKELRAYLSWAHSTAADGLLQEDAHHAPETGGRDAKALEPGTGAGGS